MIFAELRQSTLTSVLELLYPTANGLSVGMPILQGDLLIPSITSSRASVRSTLLLETKYDLRLEIYRRRGFRISDVFLGILVSNPPVSRFVHAANVACSGCWCSGPLITISGAEEQLRVRYFLLIAPSQQKRTLNYQFTKMPPWWFNHYIFRPPVELESLYKFESILDSKIYAVVAPPVHRACLLQETERAWQNEQTSRSYTAEIVVYFNTKPWTNDISSILPVFLAPFH
jgi:hypothetical protein